MGTTFSHLLTNPIEATSPTVTFSVNGVSYVLLNSPSYRGSGLSRLRNIFSCNIRLIQYGKLVGRGLSFDVVKAASVYQLDNYGAARIARRHSASFVRETRDLWPMTLIEVGGYSTRNPFIRLVQHAEDFGFRNAALVSSTLPGSYEYMQTRGLPRDKWVYLPQCPPPQHLSPIKTDGIDDLPSRHAEEIRRLKKSQHFIIAFTGSFVTASDLPTVIEAAAHLVGDRVSFLLVGHGPVEKRLRARIAELKLSNVSILPPVPKKLVGSILRNCDAGIQAFTKNPLYKYGISPNKVFEYMSNSLPTILCSEAVQDPISSSGGGIVVPPENPIALAVAVRKMADLPNDELMRIGCRAAEYVAKKHDIDSVAAEYLAHFARISSACKGRI